MSKIDWQQRAERAEAAAAEMRKLLEQVLTAGLVHSPQNQDSNCLACLSENEIKLALSSDCGKDYVPKAELDRLIEMCAEAGIGDWKGDYYLGKPTETGKLRTENNTLRAENERLREALRTLIADLRNEEIRTHFPFTANYITKKAEEALAGKEAHQPTATCPPFEFLAIKAKGAK